MICRPSLLGWIDLLVRLFWWGSVWGVTLLPKWQVCIKSRGLCLYHQWCRWYRWWPGRISWLSTLSSKMISSAHSRWFRTLRVIFWLCTVGMTSSFLSGMRSWYIRGIPNCRKIHRCIWWRFRIFCIMTCWNIWLFWVIMESRRNFWLFWRKLSRRMRWITTYWRGASGCFLRKMRRAMQIYRGSWGRSWKSRGNRSRKTRGSSWA